VNSALKEVLKMTKNSAPLEMKAPPSATPPVNGEETRPPEVVALLSKAANLLDEGKPALALDAIARLRINSPWARNALGVCQLRLGNAGVAVEVFRGLVLAAGGLILRDDAPVVFKTNYATALLAAGNVGGCQGVLAEVRDETNPAVARLRAAIRRWHDGLTFWQRLNWWMGVQPERPVVLDHRPGDLA
jgi:hypothetical protein